MRFTKRFTIRSLLALLAVSCVALAFVVNWHRNSMAQYKAIKELRPLAPNPMIYFDQMLSWNSEREVYEILDGDVLTLPPEGLNKILCRFFHADYACRPRLLVFMDTPDAQTLDVVKQLVSVRQIVFVTSSSAERKKWQIKFPSKAIMSWSEFRSASTKDDAG